MPVRLRVIIESPYAGNIQLNEEYLAQCIKHSLSLGEAPFASHGFYTKYLDDLDKNERNLGMECGFEWLIMADKAAVYTDYGISEGMIKGIELANKHGKKLEFRKILTTDLVERLPMHDPH